MKVAKIKNTKQINELRVDDNEYSVKKMLIIIIILLSIFGIFYIITSLVVKPSDNDNTNNSITELDPTKITFNHLLDRKESEYYVLATMDSLYSKSTGYTNIDYSKMYNSYINDYSKETNALEFYKIDLDDALNKNYVSKNLNITEDLDKISLNDEVLFKIKNGKIDKYFVGSSKIVSELSSLKKS